MNVVNGYAGYLPPRGLYARDCYTVATTPFAAGSLERFTRHAILAGERLLAQIG